MTLFTTPRYLDGRWVFDVVLRWQLLVGFALGHDSGATYVALHFGPLSAMLWRLVPQTL